MWGRERSSDECEVCAESLCVARPLVRTSTHSPVRASHLESGYGFRSSNERESVVSLIWSCRLMASSARLLTAASLARTSLRDRAVPVRCDIIEVGLASDDVRQGKGVVTVSTILDLSKNVGE